MASARTLPVAGTTTSRVALANCTSAKTTRARPAGTLSNRYPPAASVSVDRACDARGISSTATPGSGPPVSSRTTPTTTPDCAVAATTVAASSSSTTSHVRQPNMRPTLEFRTATVKTGTLHRAQAPAADVAARGPQQVLRTATMIGLVGRVGIRPGHRKAGQQSSRRQARRGSTNPCRARHWYAVRPVHAHWNSPGVWPVHRRNARWNAAGSE